MNARAIATELGRIERASRKMNSAQLVAAVTRLNMLYVNARQLPPRQQVVATRVARTIGIVKRRIPPLQAQERKNLAQLHKRQLAALQPQRRWFW